MKLLIAEAYHVSNFQISGGPRWIDADRYDVEAKVGGDVLPSTGQLRAMLQKLLEDRFALRVRHETKEIPVYALVTGKGDPSFNRPRTRTKASRSVFSSGGRSSRKMPRWRI